MSRRGENIRKRKDGRWEGRYVIIFNGKKKMNSVYAKSYSEVKKKLSEAKESSKNDNKLLSNPGGAVLFGYIIQSWLYNIKENRKPSTYAKYFSVCEKHFGRIKDVPFRDINDHTLQNNIEAFSNGSSENLKKFIYMIINQAVKYGNKLYRIEVPLLSYSSKTRKKPIEIFSQSEQFLLFNYLCDQSDNYKKGILLCISTGLRLGEICALKWSDIDFDNKLLRVNTTVQRIAVEGKRTKTELCEGPPKSLCSMRDIPLSDFTIQILEEIIPKGIYVISGYKPTEPRTYEKKLKLFLTEAKINEKNFHCLRHTFATNCIESGMDVKSLSEILGHADVQTTLNKYVHPTFEMKRHYMDNLSSAYYGNIRGRCF